MATSPDVPSVTDYVRKAYRDKIRDWLDFRKYWRQRRLILSNPEVLFDPPKGKRWKQPVEFAAYGMIVISLFVQGAGWALQRLAGVRSGNPVVADGFERIERLEEKLRKIKDGSDQGWPYESPEEAQKAYEQALEQVKVDVQVGERWSHAREWLTRL